MTAIKCECGGDLLPEVLEKYDASAYVGRKVLLVMVNGYRCSGCGCETIDGETINALMRRSPRGGNADGA